MTRNRTHPRAERPAGPRCRGGASSLLRLAPSRPPLAVGLPAWASREAGVLMPVTGLLAKDAS